MALYLSLFPFTALAEMNPYVVMGVEKTASAEVIKQAYRALAKKYHPDLNPGDPTGNAKFLELKEAYDILSNDQRRAQFDQYGTANSKTRPNSQEDELRRRAEDLIRRADELGAKYSNPKWSYEAQSHQFYDNRLRKWLRMGELLGIFYSVEGWSFDPSNGTYRSSDINAEWNPEDKRGWTRYIGVGRNGSLSGGRERIFLDPETGFSLGANYHPSTISDSSDLFDEVLNPLSVLAHKYKRSHRHDRSKLLDRLHNLAWTEQQKSDFIARARAHIQVYMHPDMEVRSVNDVPYSEAFVEAVIDNEASQAQPEIVIEMLRANSNRNHKTFAEIMTKVSWMKHPNASVWMIELFRNDSAAAEFVRILLSQDKEANLGSSRLEPILKIVPNGGIKPGTMNQIIFSMLFLYSESGLDRHREFLANLAELPDFAKLVAVYGIGERQMQVMSDFLKWYRGINPAAAQAYSNALNLPGASRKNFYRLSQDGTENIFHTREYEAALARTAANRLAYLEVNLPRFAMRATAQSFGLRCEKVFR